ncbi:MAG: hypothetical protein KDD15_19600, partial [Lewinella sp.]|nr:hypothetical protein [Lewinella sp.]
MTKKHLITILFPLLTSAFGIPGLRAQQIPIQSYSVDAGGQVRLTVNSTADHYYLLKIRHQPDADFQLPTSMTLGQAGTTTLTEPMAHYPLEHYQVLEYPVSDPADSDGDGVDDITEYYNMPIQGPLNAAVPVDLNIGTAVIDSFTTFQKLSITKQHVQWSEFLDGKGYVKFIIVDFHTDQPKLYFIDSYAYDLHDDFAKAVGIDYLGDNVKKGQIIYHPTVLSNNGTLGTFTFNYSNGHGQDFEVVQKCYELLAANMPFIRNNLSYFITERNEDEYARDQALFQNSRIPILFETDLFAGIDYWGLNQAEGYGYFHQISLEEIPGARDIVLYETLPNSLPRVGGIMTSVLQTPLSHVNLRA